MEGDGRPRDRCRLDVIVCWPKYADYPLWRQFIRANRYRIDRVLVVFTEHAGNDLSQFVRLALGPGVECFDSPDRGERDWRDVAVNFALDQSRAEWVWFTEQDFLVHDPAAFWAAATRVMGLSGGVTGVPLGFRDEHRWHPASLLVPRVIVDRTSRYFGPDPIDHFVRFSRELDSLGPVEHLPTCYRHMQGLSNNHFLAESGATEGYFRRDEWRAYLRACLSADVPLDPGWRDRAIVEIGSAPP